MTEVREEKVRCSRCKLELEREMFWKNSSRNNGLQSSCISCHRSQVKRYNEKNPGLNAAHVRAYEANPENADKVAMWKRNSKENRAERMRDPEYAEMKKQYWRDYYHNVRKPKIAAQKAAAKALEGGQS